MSTFRSNHWISIILKHGLTLISLMGGFVHTLRFPPMAWKQNHADFWLGLKKAENRVQFAPKTRFDSRSLFSFSSGFPLAWLLTCYLPTRPKITRNTIIGWNFSNLGREPNGKQKKKEDVPCTALASRKELSHYGWISFFSLSKLLF